jgi:hypothetical protein
LHVKNIFFTALSRAADNDCSSIRRTGVKSGTVDFLPEKKPGIQEGINRINEIFLKRRAEQKMRQ